MDYFKLFNIFGIGLQLIGALILVSTDSLALRIAAAYGSIPGNPLLDSYEAAKKGETRIVSEEERNFIALEASANGNKVLRDFRISVCLVFMGMVIQLIIEIFRP